MLKTVVVNSIKPCCRDEKNLVIIESKAHVEVKRCTVCKCRHFRAFMTHRPAGTFTEVPAAL